MSSTPRIPKAEIAGWYGYLFMVELAATVAFANMITRGNTA
jgi:hypothetical protein